MCLMICFVARSSVLEEVGIIEEAKECFSQEDSLLRVLSGVFSPDLSSLALNVSERTLAPQVQKSPWQAGPRSRMLWATGHPGSHLPPSSFSISLCMLVLFSSFFQQDDFIITSVYIVENTDTPWRPPLNSYSRVPESVIRDSHWSGMGLVLTLVPVSLAGAKGPCWTDMTIGSSLWPGQEGGGWFQKGGRHIQSNRWGVCYHSHLCMKRGFLRPTFKK